MVEIRHRFELRYNALFDEKFKTKMTELGIDIRKEKLFTGGVIIKNGETLYITSKKDFLKLNKNDIDNLETISHKHLKCECDKESFNRLIDWLNSENHLWSAIID